MPFTLTMPKLSPTMTEGTIAKWHKKVGDYVETGDLLFEIATDKATVEHNALDAGWLRKILRKDGDKAVVNEPLAILTEQKEESIDGYEPEGVTPPPKAAAKTSAVAKAPVTKTEAPKSVSKPAPKTAPQPKYGEKQERIFASPLAKTLAHERGIDIARLKGSGPQGRIMSRDLDQEVAAAQEIPSYEVEEIALSPMRQVIAERLQYSKSTIPHFYIRQEVDVQPLVTLREEIKKFELNFTVNDFIVKAVATALHKHPNVNCGFQPERQALLQYPTVDLAIAVTIPGGLITPIVRQAETKSLAKLSQEIKALSNRAKEGKLQPEEYQGGSFTISNLGMFGVTDFQAIVNPPQAAILAVGAIQDKPVVKNGAVVPGKVLSLVLSCDHRAIDGAEAAEFMRSLRQLIENPILFLSE